MLSKVIISLRICCDGELDKYAFLTSSPVICLTLNFFAYAT